MATLLASGAAGAAGSGAAGSALTGAASSGLGGAMTDLLLSGSQNQAGQSAGKSAPGQNQGFPALSATQPAASPLNAGDSGSQGLQRLLEIIGSSAGLDPSLFRGQPQRNQSKGGGGGT